MRYERDPVSVLLDRGAREMLARAYAARRGEWVMTRLADPTDRHRMWAKARYGIDIDGPDNAPTLSGKHIDAHTRWGRAFMRALWYQHRWYGQGRGKDRATVRTERRTTANGSPLQIQWGRRLPGSAVLPRGRAVRIRVAVGGKTALLVVHAKNDADRIWADDGSMAGRFAVAERRDWA